MSEQSTDNTEKHWEFLGEQPIYDGFYSVSKASFKHTKFNGGWTGTVEREVLNRGNVIGVLAHDPETDQIALVEQFRFGAKGEADNPWLMEVIAGMVETGEQPDEVATREAWEEAGITVTAPTLISQYYSSPSSTTEQVFVYYAACDLSDVGGVHGLEEEDEDIRVHVVPANDAIRMLENGVIKNAISVVAMQWFQYQRAIKQL